MRAARQFHFWPVAITGGVVTITVAIGLGALLQFALAGTVAASDLLTPTILGLVFWTGGMFYAYDHRRRHH